MSGSSILFDEIHTGTQYEITTYTSDKSGASTDADVYVVLYGVDMCTQQKSLCATKAERKSSFKKGAMDKFVIEVNYGFMLSIATIVLETM